MLNPCRRPAIGPPVRFWKVGRAVFGRYRRTAASHLTAARQASAVIPPCSGCSRGGEAFFQGSHIRWSRSLNSTQTTVECSSPPNGRESPRIQVEATEPDPELRPRDV